MQLVVEFAIRTVLIAAATAGVLRVLKINMAAACHAVWTSVLIVMLLLPVWTVWGPRVAVRVLAPVPEKATQAAATTDVFQPSTVSPDLFHAETSPRAPRTLEWSWTECVLAVYLIGVGTLLVRLVLGTLQAHLLVRRACRRDGRLFSASCATPVTLGWFRPVVVLPEGWSEWPAPQLDAVLTHESEHARRRDPLIQWLALLNRAVFWFHPLAWWLERRLAALAEEACDAAVLAHGHDPRDYSRYLIDMARSVASSGARLHVWGMAMPGRFLERRIRRIVEGGPLPRLTRARLVATATACMATSIIFAAGSVDHQKAAREPNEKGIAAQSTIGQYNAKLTNSYAQSTRSRVPLTAETETRVVNGPTSTSLQAWRSDGSHVVLHDVSGGISVAAREIVDIASGTGTLVDPLTHLVAKQPLRVSAATRMSTFAARCEDLFGWPVTCEAADQRMHGYELMRVNFGDIDSTRGTRSDHEYLVAPALTFLPLREKHWINGALVSDRIVTALKVGQPDPDLFVVPSNYRVVEKISEYLRLKEESRGRVADPAYLSAMDAKVERAKVAVAAGQ